MEKCTRCGKCCLQAPCMLIPIGEEVYDNEGNHKCPHFSKVDEIATCSIYENVKGSGTCTNRFKNVEKI